MRCAGRGGYCSAWTALDTLYAAGRRVLREWIAAGHGSEYAVATFDLPVSPDELKARKNPIYHRMLSEGVALMPGAAEAVPVAPPARMMSLVPSPQVASEG